MKGTVLVCLREVIISAGGDEVWRACLVDGGIEPFTIFSPSADVPDEQAVAVIEAACRRLGLTLQQAADAFGNHWVNSYSPKVYKSFYAKHTTARGFFADINEMHERLTRRLPDARPPRFRLDWAADDVLVMHYESHRSLIEIAIGMAKAIGSYYREDLEVSRVSATALKVVFRSKRGAPRESL